MSRLRPFLGAVAGIAASVVALTTASAAAPAPFKDALVQPPSLGQPQRGSIAGALSKLAFGPAELSRGAYSLPLPVQLPGERGALQASVIPSYSAESGIGEWGVGWGAELSIKRHRQTGEIDFTAGDGFVSPWGRLRLATDGAYYPAGLSTMIKLRQQAGGWVATKPDGTKFYFDAADATVTTAGTYAWNLSRVENLLGDKTQLVWVKNASGRAFLGEVRWGGRAGAAQYRMSLEYELLATQFSSFVSGARMDLDRRVSRVRVDVMNAGAFAPRWTYKLGYEASPTGPAFYLQSVTKVYASGASDPPVSYAYDFSTDQLQFAQFESAPHLNALLSEYGDGMIQPDKASMTDLERNGLTDLELYSEDSFIRQTEAGFVVEPLPPLSGNENESCRPDVTSTAKPRMLARMHGDAASPNVVVTLKNSAGTKTRVTICDRAGLPQYDQWVLGAWDVNATNRLADVDLDHKPDLVRVFYGGVEVMPNTSAAPGQFSFAVDTVASTLMPKVTPTTAWVLDGNGDGRPDLMVRHAAGVTVWRGIGKGKFEKQGTTFGFQTAGGGALANLPEYQFSHGDFNNDGLSDLVLTKGQTVLLFTNRGTSFVETPVAAFATIPWSVSFPVVADLSGSGNEQIVMAAGGVAHTLQLTRPSTGLLLSADDGKGTLVKFGYTRAKPVPGVNQLYSLLASMTTSSSGFDLVTTTYSYGEPVWHTVGKYLVGFRDAHRKTPFLDQLVAFHNDNDVAGVVTSTRDQDERTPGWIRFGERTLQSASYKGVPWMRLASERHGMRRVDGSDEVAVEKNILAYTRDLCPSVVETTGLHGTLRREIDLATIPVLSEGIDCVPATQRLVGTHADSSLDFTYELAVEYDALGRAVRAKQLGGAGPVMLQEIAYDAANRIASVTVPGTGTTTYGYDTLGLLATVTAPDGTIEKVDARDPLTDMLLGSTLDRGGSSTWTRSSAFDGLERLKASWDNLSGTSATSPATTIGYDYASATEPARITTRSIIDVATGAAMETAELFTADETPIAVAHRIPGGWAVASLARQRRNQLDNTMMARAPIGALDLDGLTYAQLYAGASVIGNSVSSGFGEVLSSSNVVQAGVVSTSSDASDIVEGVLVARHDEGGFSTRTGSDAEGLALWFQDQTGVFTAYEYDAMGRLRRVHTPDGTQRVDFDSYGRPSVVARDGVQRIEYAYDGNNQMNLRRELGADGTLERTVAFTRDVQGRVTNEHAVLAATDEVRDVSTGYDGQIGPFSGIGLPGQKGFVTSVSGPGFSKRSMYRADGKITLARFSLDGWRTLQQETTYHTSGAIAHLVTTVEDGAGNVLISNDKELEYDAYGRIDRCLVNGQVVYSIAYDAEGKQASATFANGQTLSFDYDPVTRRRRGYAMSGGTGPSTNVSWQRDTRGLVASETTALGGESKTRTYQYDGRRYLTGATDAEDTASYSYDSSGLIASINDERGARGLNRAGATLTAGERSYTFDHMGRVVAEGDLSLEYGPSGQVEAAVNGSRVLSFVYDEADQRILKRVNGVAVAGYVGGGYLTADTFIEPVEVAGQLVGVLDNGVLHLLPTDARGSVIAGEDGGLELPTPYGVKESFGPYAEALAYVQKGYDKDLGTIRMGLRDYDPYLARFWTPDPKFLGDIDACLRAAAECNLYGYAGNNPVSFVDPSGMERTKLGRYEDADADTPVPYETKTWLREQREKSGTNLQSSHPINVGDQVVTPISYANTIANIKQDWRFGQGVVKTGEDCTLWVFCSNTYGPARIPEKDLKQIEDALRSAQERVGAWEFKTDGGYLVRIWIAVPIGGQIVQGAVGGSTSTTDMSGWTFAEAVETSHKGSIGLKIPVRGFELGGGYEYNRKTTDTNTKTGSTTNATGGTTGLQGNFQAEAGFMVVGVSKDGWKPTWSYVMPGDPREDRVVVWHRSDSVK